MFNTLVSHILLGLDNRVVPCQGYLLADLTLRYKTNLGQSLHIFSHISYPVHNGESDSQVTNYPAIPQPLNFHQVINPHPPGREPH